MPSHRTAQFTLFVMLTVFLSMACIALATETVVEKSHHQDDHHKEGPQTVESCGSCHKCEQPTRQDPCLVDCPRYAGYFHSQHGVDDGPEIVIIDQLANYYRPVVFAHKLHAEMSDMTGGCENCHHYSEQSGTIPTCRECHVPNSIDATLGQPALKGAYHRQCINCHLDWAHENACGFCHEQVAGSRASVQPDSTDIIGLPHPKIESTPTFTYETSYEDGPLVTFHHADHVEMFGQQCVDCHRGDSCARCHDNADKPPARIDHASSCCSCHGERDCNFCHTNQAIPNFTHAISTGWDLDPYHSDIDCSVCHGDPETFRHPATRCVNCHIHWEVGSFDHAVTGLVFDEEHVDLECENCHLDMNFSGAPSCEECHDEPMYPERVPGKRKLH